MIRTYFADIWNQGRPSPTETPGCRFRSSTAAARGVPCVDLGSWSRRIDTSRLEECYQLLIVYIYIYLYISLYRYVLICMYLDRSILFHLHVYIHVWVPYWCIDMCITVYYTYESHNILMKSLSIRMVKRRPMVGGWATRLSICVATDPGSRHLDSDLFYIKHSPQKQCW